MLLDDLELGTRHGVGLQGGLRSLAHVRGAIILRYPLQGHDPRRIAILGHAQQMHDVQAQGLVRMGTGPKGSSGRKAAPATTAWRGA